MIKGVNRQIIEVHDPENPYFERAILFVRPEYGWERPQMLKDQANRLMKMMGTPPAPTRVLKFPRRWKMGRVGLLAGGLSLAAAVIYGIFSLC